MNARKNRYIVISGCSSGGKSTLLSELSSNGYSVVQEVGREIVKEQLSVDGDILPWKKPIHFCEILIERSVIAYHEALKMPAAKDNLIFFDRSFLEGVSYFQTLEIDGANKYDYLIHELRYYSTILMAPPWKEIFCEDGERKTLFKNAVEEYDRLSEFYAKNGYEIVELPKTSVKERFQFVTTVLTFKDPLYRKHTP
jgi:predicted ATPase